MTWAHVWDAVVGLAVVLIIFLFYYAQIRKQTMQETTMELREALFGEMRPGGGEDE